MKKRAAAQVFTSILLAGVSAKSAPPRVSDSSARSATSVTSAGSPALSNPNEWEATSLSRLAIASQLGVHHRLDTPPAFMSADRVALGGGFEVQAFLGRRFAVTLAWERFGLGSERTGITDFGSASITRRVDSASLGMRVAPWANEYLSATVGVGIGAAWQHATADGLLWPQLQPSLGTSVVCSGSGSAAPTMRVALGLEAPLGKGLAIFASGGFGVFALQEGALGQCILGAGSTQMFAGRIGFSYAFEVGGGGG